MELLYWIIYKIYYIVFGKNIFLNLDNIYILIIFPWIFLRCKK